MAGFYDAQNKNDITRNVRQYTDLDLFFGRKTNSDVNKVTDIQAVKRSIRNLVLLNAYEKPFHPEISGGVRGMLFENMTPITAAIIAKKVEDVINNFIGVLHKNQRNYQTLVRWSKGNDIDDACGQLSTNQHD